MVGTSNQSVPEVAIDLPTGEGILPSTVERKVKYSKELMKYKKLGIASKLVLGADGQHELLPVEL